MKYFILLALVGCAAGSKKLKGPDGSEHYSLQCFNINACYEKASELCGKYKIVNSIPATEEEQFHLLVKCEEK